MFAALMLSAASCVDQVFPKGTEPTTPMAAADISISTSNVTDTSFDFTLSVEGKAAYFAYLVDDDAPALDEQGNVTLDPETLYSVGYKGIAKGNVKYSEETKTIKFTQEAEPFTTYTIYAVASSEEGNVGSIVYKQVKTTDTVIPEPIDYDCEKDAAVFYLLFSEPVEYVAANKVTATLYAGYVNASTGQYPYLDDSQAMGTAEGTVTVEDDIVTIDFGKQITGTIYGVSFPEGTFVDAAGNKCEAVVTTCTKGVPSSPFVGMIEYGTVEVTVPKIDYIENYSKYIEIPTKTYVQQVFNAQQLKQMGSDPVHYIVKHTSVNPQGGVEVKETTYELSSAPYYGAISYNSIGVRMSVAPAAGDEVTIVLPAGTWIDVYGNNSPEIKISAIYGAPAYPAEGSYLINCKYPFVFQLEKLNDTQYLFSADYFGLVGKTFGPVLVFDADPVTRTLTCNNKQYIQNEVVEGELFGYGFMWYSKADDQMLVFWGGGNGGDPIVIDYNVEGVPTTISYFDFSVHNGTTGKYIGTLCAVEDGTTISPGNSAAAAAKPARLESVEYIPSPMRVPYKK